MINCSFFYFKIYIQRGESRYDAELQVPAANSRGSVMFWGGIARTGPVALVQVTGVIEQMEYLGKVKTMDQYRYRELLAAYLLPFIEENKERAWVFQQDGASIHTSKIMKEWFSEFGIDVPEWPAKSPDLSVIENIWGRIKLLLQREEVLTVADVERVVPKLWNKVTSDVGYLNNLYNSIPSRVQKVLDNDGARIRY